ncbi:MAG: hypothetical protein HY278_04300 [candidate division NC10 bacterium]|nr:hypothetical protein [candidate division NC10 bacterium]
MFCMISGASRDGSYNLVNPAGKTISAPIDLVTISAFGKDVNLSDLVTRVRRIAKGLDKGLRKVAPDKPRTGADALIALEIEFADEAPQDPVAAGGAT